MLTTPARIHVARSPTQLADGEVYHYAYLRYEVWDEKKNRLQPKALASLGRVDGLDEDRLKTVGGFLKEWLRKDSSLPFEALRDRLDSVAPTIRILCSRDFGLRWIIEQAWQELGYSEAVAELSRGSAKLFDVDLAIFAMVLVQLVAPQSKRGMAEWRGINLFFPEGESLKDFEFYRAMDVLEAGYQGVERKLSERLEELGVETKALAHDTTSQGFMVRYDDVERAIIESERQASGNFERPATVNNPPIRMRGHSKNKRGDLPQVVLEAVLGDHGLIVHHETHAGNTSDNSVTPATVKVLNDLGYKDVDWSGDSGTNSVTNRQALRAGRFNFVLGEGVGRTNVVEEVLSRPGRYRPHPDRPELSYKCVIAFAGEEAGKGKEAPERLYIIRHNTKQESHARHRIARHLEAIDKILEKGGAKAEALPSHKTYKRYVCRDGRKKDAKGRPAGPVRVDRKAVQRAYKLAGKSVIGTDTCNADPLRADGVYRNLFDVEAAFRTLKSTIELGPVRHRRADRIRAHAMIAVMAFNLAAWLEFKTGLTIERLKRSMDNFRVQEVEFGAAKYWERVELEASQEEIIDALGYEEPPKRFTVEIAR
jgi:hypothetical protein